MKEKIMGVNWKTSLGGLLMALGATLSGMFDPPWLAELGKILLAAGALIMGRYARDEPTPH